MNPVLKTYLDSAMNYHSDSRAPEEAMRQALSLIGGDTEGLVASLEYLLAHGDTDRPEAVGTFLEAVLEADGLKGFVESITDPEGFVKYLGYDPFREIIRTRFRGDPHVQALARAAARLERRFPFAVVVAICDLGVASGREFLRPARLDSYEIDDMLGWLRLIPDQFFLQVADSVVDECMAYRPQSKGEEWLSRFLEEVIKYYARPAKVWMAKQIERRKSAPMFWRSAIAHLLDEQWQDFAIPDLTPEQLAWMRRVRMKRIRDEIRREYRDLIHLDRSGQVIVQAPMLLHDVGSEFAGHAFRPVWSWLQSEAVESVIYSWFREACSALPDDYASPEDSITGALCAYLKSHAARYRELINTAWRAVHPKEDLKLGLEYVDCRKGRDVGGADLVFVLSAMAKDTYARTAFSAFQCKKVKAGSLPFSEKELAQKEQLRAFTDSAYYMLYPCETTGSEARGPVVVSARTIDGLLRARSKRTLDRQVLLTVGRGLEEYFVADLLPGWSGDERWDTPEKIREVVEGALRPVWILQMTVIASPVDQG